MRPYAARAGWTSPPHLGFAPPPLVLPLHAPVRENLQIVAALPADPEAQLVDFVHGLEDGVVDIVPIGVFIGEA